MVMIYLFSEAPGDIPWVVDSHSFSLSLPCLGLVNVFLRIKQFLRLNKFTIFNCKIGVIIFALNTSHHSLLGMLKEEKKLTKIKLKLSLLTSFKITAKKC